MFNYSNCHDDGGKHSIEVLAHFSNSQMGLEPFRFAQMPTPFTLNDRIRVFFSSRDCDSKSHLYYVDLDRTLLSAIGMAKKCSFVQDESFFDSDGVMPSCLIFRDSILYLYYIGWQKTSIEPYSLTIGVAISRDYGETFSERFIQPIIGKSEENPVFVTTPFVWETSEGFEILFSRGGEWIKKEGGFDPTYKLATAKSKDGFLWNSFSSIHTGVDENSSLARPVQFNGHLITSQRPNMNFRTKGNGYKIVFFNVGNLLEPCSVEWIFRDSVVKDQSYGFPICIDEKTYLLFNGEGFGIDGFYVGQVSW